MTLEVRTTGGYPSVVLVPSPEEAKLIDQYLGDCGPGPVAVVGQVKMSDGYGPAYIDLRNPAMNPHAPPVGE